MTLEIASATSVMGGAWAIPDYIHLRAQLLLERCVRAAGLGGSATLDFQNLISWATVNPVNPLFDALPPVPASASFFTVTISGPSDKLHSPGDYNPIVPRALRDENERAYHAESKERLLDPHMIAYLDRANFWESQGEAMSTTGDTSTPWWRPQPRNSNQMSYLCDDGLGNPSFFDCLQVQLNQLNHPGDSLTVGPGLVQFLHSNNCFVAVSATVDLVLTWSQIRIAIATLMGTCVNQPYHTDSRGGRAYHKSAPASSVPPNRDKSARRKRNPDELTGLNALPPGTNVTIFEQSEPWTNESDELRSCTWLAVSNEHSVKSCAHRG